MADDYWKEEHQLLEIGAGWHCSDHKPNKRRHLFIPNRLTISKSTRRMTRGQHGTTWDCWRHEYYSSLSITLSLLSLDRDNTDKKDHGVTCAAAGLEEEPDSQGKMQNHRGQQESCDHVLETFESRWSTWIPSLQETPRNPKSRVAITSPTWTASNLLYLLSLADHFVHPSRERERPKPPYFQYDTQNHAYSRRANFL